MGIHILDAMIGRAGPISGVRARPPKQFLQVDVDDTTDFPMDSGWFYGLSEYGNSHCAELDTPGVWNGGLG